MTQKGKLSTIEGFISNAKDNLKASLDDGYYSEMDDNYVNEIKNTIKNGIILITIPEKRT